jgi:acyl-CoA thioester hydrolase
MIDDYPLVITIPLLWGDHDAFGHVNNLVYLRWCETARVAYLERVGMWAPLPPTGVGPILASISCDYRLPLTYPDTVRVGARIVRIGRSSMTMEHAVFSENAQRVAAEVRSTLVLLDYANGKPVPVPPEARRAIEELEGRPLTAG